MNKVLFIGGLLVFILSIVGTISDPILTESGRVVYDLSKSIIGICLIYLSFKIDKFALGEENE